MTKKEVWALVHRLGTSPSNEPFEILEVPEKYRPIIRARNSGMTYDGIKHRFHVSNSTISQLFKDYAGAVTYHPVKESAVKNYMPDIIRMYKSGMSANDIAKAYQVGRTTITRYLKKEGIELRDTHFKPRVV